MKTIFSFNVPFFLRFSFLFIAVAALVGCASMNECGGVHCNNPNCQIHMIKTAGEGDQIAFLIDVLDDCEHKWFFGTKLMCTKAELWLKLSISDIPGIYWLYPLNVGHTAGGSQHIEYKTPFFISHHRHGIITAELLDDDRLSETEEEALGKVFSAGAMLVCDGISYWAYHGSGRAFISTTTKEEVRDLMRGSAEIVVKNAKPFKSLGSRQYIVINTGSLFVSNPITITEPSGSLFSSNARCDIRFHLVK